MTDDDYQPPPRGESVIGSGWGLAALLIGCTLLISACVLMVFNIILFRGGMVGIPRDLARAAGVVSVAGVALLGLLAIRCGAKGWSGAGTRGESPALGVAGTAAAVVGTIAWLVAGADLLMILGVFR